LYPVQAIIAQFRNEMQAPEHAKWIHHESDTALTSATALALRLRQVFKHIATRLDQSEGNVPSDHLMAFHTDTTTRAGLATGLGLHDVGATSPHQMITHIATWATDTAASVPAQTPVHSAIKHQMPLLNSAIQTAPHDATSLIAAMTLPQILLGLGRLSAT